jgi:beta-lactamase class A
MTVKELCAAAIEYTDDAAANLPLRAGMPKTWYVADKTGLGGAHNATGDSETRNDIAYVSTAAVGRLVASKFA